MASSNRHWPSMFKSKPCNSHQWQHDINQSLLSGGCLRTPYNSVGGCDQERSPEPKPRWNPKPEQIRILEAIFNSGMVNPPRDEIRKIRAQLQEFGQVGDANVFYWFQNRKSRSKHKLRHHNHKPTTSNHKPSQYSNNNSSNNSSAATASSSNTNNNIVLPNTSSFEPHIIHDLHFQPSSPLGQGLCFPTSSHVHSGMGGGPSTSLNLLSEIMNHHSKDDADHDHIGAAGKLLELNFTAPSTTIITTTSIAPLTAPGSTSADHAPISAAIGQHHGVIGGEGGIVVGPGGEGKSTVFINDVAFEVGVGPFNVREAFGEEAVLINSYGHPLLTDEWGLTLHSLHHGACYYLI